MMAREEGSAEVAAAGGRGFRRMECLVGGAMTAGELGLPAGLRRRVARASGAWTAWWAGR
jgi:hypothetical protein